MFLSKNPTFSTKINRDHLQKALKNHLSRPYIIEWGFRSHFAKKQIKISSRLLNIFNSGFLHHRDFRFPPGATEPVFWESDILDSQLLVPKYPVSRLKFGIVPVLSWLILPVWLVPWCKVIWLSRIADSQ